jgi:L-cystine uptake protein TcyP (sodium:dicarboxylate symporter family)
MKNILRYEKNIHWYIIIPSSYILILYGYNVLLYRKLIIVSLVVYPIIIGINKIKNRQDIIGTLGMMLGLLLVTYNSSEIKLIGSVVILFSLIYISIDFMKIKK